MAAPITSSAQSPVHLCFHIMPSEVRSVPTLPSLTAPARAGCLTHPRGFVP